MLTPLDRLIAGFDRALKTVVGPSAAGRPQPGSTIVEADLSAEEKRVAAALLRVDHVGEVCAQALYQGQALTARDSTARDALARAADEEVDHLAWTERRIAELGGRKSLLNPLWYAGSFAIGAAAGFAGDRWSLGFLAETERQVVEHLQDHLRRLPPRDGRSRAVLEAMQRDEARHSTTALTLGAIELADSVKLAMRGVSRVMTSTAYWV